MNWLEKIRKKAYRWLRWSEQYTKTDMVYLAKGGSWLTLDTVATSGITFLTALAFANFVSKDVYGTYKFVLSAASILAIPTLQGMSTAVTKSVAQGYGGSLISALKTRLRWGMLTTLGGFGASFYYFINDNIELTIAFAIVALLVPLRQSLSTYFSALTGKKDFKRNSLYDIGTRVFAGAFLISAILLTDNLHIILLTYFLSWVIAHAFFFYRTLDKLDLSEKVDDALDNYGKHLSAMGVISTIANNLDKILLFHYLGAAQVAIYSFAKAIPEQLKGVFKSLSNLALPKFANRSVKSIQRKLWQKIGVYIAVILPLVVIYYFLAPYIYEIFFPEYTESISLSQLYAFSLLGTASIIPVAGLNAKELTKELYTLNLVRDPLHIAILAFLVIQFGIHGAIIAIILKRVLNLFLSAYLLLNSN